MEKSDKPIKELIRGNDVFIQVGTNTGLDYFRSMVFTFKPALVILIEPNRHLIDFIRENYAGIQANIETVAIVEQERDVKLYYPNKEGYYHGHFSLLPMNDWGDDLIEINAKGVTMSSIFEKYNIKKVDYLCIDTEGYDALILETIDFEKIKIDLIVFENWHFAPEVFTKFNENWKELGSAADDRICRHLQNKGFKLYEDPDCWYNRIAINENLNSNSIL